MTRYDPFSYGQVPLSPKAQPAAPDDMLFADAAPGKQPAPASDWAPPAEFGSAFPGGGAATDETLAFGADILGEAVPAAAARPAAVAARAQPAATPRTAATAAPRPQAASPMAQGKSSEPATRSPAAPRRGGVPIPMPMPRRATMAGVIVPVVLVGVGGCGASWLYLMQQNTILAGILGLASLVGGALAWVMLRG